MHSRLIIVMGVSGCGKSLVANHLAQHFGIEFVDGDDLHPPENVARMSAGIKLDDETRKPWLNAICDCAESCFSKNQSIVIACSALKQIYRDQIRSVSCPVIFVFLSGPQPLILKRIQAREKHYMPTSLLDSQFADLEDPTAEGDVVVVNVDQAKDTMLAEAARKVECQMPNDK